ncbi:MAG: hypothetical protein HYX63_05185 [Gammaproteobacteria bacterium]|nr:hypothetical protein [Gammaproteobacteria bacterium]
MDITFLATHPPLGPRLATLHVAEWQHLYAGWNAVIALAEFEAQYSDGRLPTTLVALEGGLLLGSVSPIYDDLPGWEHFNPWLASLLVLPEFRGAGTCHSRDHEIRVLTRD